MPLFTQPRRRGILGSCQNPHPVHIQFTSSPTTVRQKANQMEGGELMAAQKLKVLIAALAAIVLVLAAGVAYANSSQPTSPGSSGDNGAQVAANDESDGAGEAGEPGDVDGPGDTED